MNQVIFESIKDDYIDYITRVSVGMVYVSLSSSCRGLENRYRLMYHNVDHDYSAVMYGNLDYLIKRMHHIMENLQ